MSSKNKRRNQAQRQRAARALQRNEANLVANITRNEKLVAKKAVTPPSKQPLPESKSGVPPAVHENPYLRMLAKIDADNAKQLKARETGQAAESS